ncbi:AsmA family protein [Legionella jordanis]|uniref:AsmA family protein n=1 Tax=Legionella jordanis TaxID=456 RepID=UPI000EFEC061|nr:AsmA family protein [Legionella jordanis]RMX21046.1 AsmA family protein [Legionella jordanis]
MNLIKKSVIGLSLFLVTITFILWALAKSLKPEIIKDYVSSQLSALTHQQSTIQGDISWQIFPRPAVKITGVQIGQLQGETPYAIKLDNLLFNLKITPLLRGKLVFSELNVNGFEVDINPEAHNSSESNKQPAASKQTSDNNIAEKFAIARVLLSHGQIRWKSQQKTLSLTNLQIGAEQFNLNKLSFPLQFKTLLTLNIGENAVARAQINFKGNTSLSSTLFSKPLLTIENSPLYGQLAIQDVKVQQLKINKIGAHVKTKNGVLQLNPLTLSLYNGESVGDLAYEYASKKLTINQMATNINGNRLSFDLLQKKLLKGGLDFSLHTQANLQNPNWLETAMGNGNLSIKDGEMESINLNKVIDETSRKINQLINGKKDEVKDVLQLSQFDDPAFFRGNTNFKLLTIQYSLENAVLASNSLVLQTDRLQLKGDGALNLKDNSLNSHLLATVSLNDPEVDKIQQILGGNFPLMVKGSLTEPLVLPDLSIINPILTRYWLKEALVKPVKEIHKQIKTLLSNEDS